MRLSLSLYVSLEMSVSNSSNVNVWFCMSNSEGELGVDSEGVFGVDVVMRNSLFCTLIL